MTDSLQLPDRQRVAASFSRAAETYDHKADLQRLVGSRLLSLLPASLSPQRWVDLGCGTGYFCQALARRYPCAQGIAVDIAEGMLRQTCSRYPRHWAVAGDAEALPLSDGCADLLFSSLAVQWCTDIAGVLREGRRVLRSGGILAFSSLCAGTLRELRESWQQVDDFVHVNRFRHFDQYRTACAASGLQVLELQQKTQTQYFADLRALGHSFRELGAYNLNSGRSAGLAGRARIEALRSAYERFRQPPGLPVSYQLVYGVLQKRGD